MMTTRSSSEGMPRALYPRFSCVERGDDLVRIHQIRPDDSRTIFGHIRSHPYLFRVIFCVFVFFFSHNI